ncbi:MAG: NAD(P)H-binding protein [Deltaproteobacteria bacterium]|jgi:NADH dehydrogenase|nr:NAD(P)H-binding protein [Deltaproteobacteria bacterium]
MNQRSLHAVTGAFGFSGKYLAARLLRAGRQVVTLTNSPGRANPFGGAVPVRSLDFARPEALTADLKDVQVLYNTYWPRFSLPGHSHADAVRNTMVLFKAAEEAGVERIVHISIANPDENSALSYYRSKGYLERVLRESGLSYAILRPAVIFGLEGVLLNNIIWALRYAPVFGIPGNGAYGMQPIHVDDLAALMLEQGQSREKAVIQALGPEDFSYAQWIRKLSAILGRRRLLFPMPVWLGYWGALLLGKFMGDIFVTREELAALTGDLLHVPGALPTGTTRLSEWIMENIAGLGLRYTNETARRRDRSAAY